MGVNGNYQYLNDWAGVIYNLDFGTSTTATSSTAGDVIGYFKDNTVQQGQTGSTTMLATEKGTFPIGRVNAHSSDRAGAPRASCRPTGGSGGVVPQGAGDIAG